MGRQAEIAERGVGIPAEDLPGIPLEDLLGRLRASEKGLRSEEANARKEGSHGLSDGLARLSAPLRLLARQFSHPLAVLLIVAVCLSAWLGETSESMMVLAILLLTGALGFYQEWKADKAMWRLRARVATRHTLLRDGKEADMTRGGIVPGDVILLDAGDMIPADCRILSDDNLHVNEASITGEGYPVEKGAGTLQKGIPLSARRNCLWQGTSVVSGTARALVVTAGRDTVYGRLVQGLAGAVETGYESGMRRFGLFLLKATLLLSGLILLGNLFLGRPAVEAVLFSLALAVGMAPEFLPAVMTYAMSMGARRMMRKKVVVKRLAAMFNLGAVDLLCTDKTGTITEGKARVHACVDRQGLFSERVMRYACLNARLQQGFRNAVDAAMAELPSDTAGWEKQGEIPYDFTRKRISILARKGGERLLITKGALPQVMQACTHVGQGPDPEELLQTALRADIEQAFERHGREGYRVLGLAVKRFLSEALTEGCERDMVFLGFILLEDPLKPDAPEALARLESMGVQVRIVTGDNRHAAVHVASRLGLMRPGVLTGAEIAAMGGEALKAGVRETDVFAEIEPQQKEMVIKALRSCGFTVGYLGDGINDVGALHEADIGISTDDAADAARDASDVVMLERNLAVLAEGIEEGRRAFRNSMKYIRISTSATFGNMFSMACTTLFLPFLPMLPRQILLNNLISDLPFLQIAGDRDEEGGPEKPGKWDLREVRRFMLYFGLHSSLFDIAAFVLLYAVLALPADSFRSAWFIESTLSEVLVLFIIRTRTPILKSKPGRGVLVTAAVAAALTATVILPPWGIVFGFGGLGAVAWVTIAAILLAYTLSGEWLKRRMPVLSP